MPTDPIQAASVQRELAFSAPIQNGDSGMRVQRVQEWLKYHNNATSIDGGFGPATQVAVGQFQQSKGLPQTGVVDQATWNLLKQPLVDALTPPAVTPNDTLASLTKKVAERHLASKPIEIGGENSGPWVRVYMNGNEGSDWPWCAGFVSFLLKHAAFLQGKNPPIAGSFSCDSLAYQAKDSGNFVNGGNLAGLSQVFIFLVRKSTNQWSHTGIGFDQAGGTFSTIEGNTNDDGSSNGYEVLKRVRSASGKDFIKL